MDDNEIKDLLRLADSLLDIAYEIEVKSTDLNLRASFPTDGVIRFASEILFKIRGL